MKKTFRIEIEGEATFEEGEAPKAVIGVHDFVGEVLDHMTDNGYSVFVVRIETADKGEEA